jgi:hypothetical protein
VTWNMDYWQHPEVHEDAWHWLFDELDPELALGTPGTGRAPLRRACMQRRLVRSSPLPSSWATV